ncbi:MAG TPA: HPF/RaiA family ribosome-associated protein [Bradyrhizobium sp.]|nr:HPF/RaiA family ribosome-associated protein [Stellaceae bacterium]HUO00213.1 HPF/RaiA family ribosome-associated protein [Bradyrhizobium sp.]
MRVPLQITFRRMDTSPALETRIRQRAEELEQYCDRITACHVTVEAQHRRHQQGNLFRVSIDLAVPGDEITASSGRDPDHAHENAHVAVRDAFDALRRRLEDHMRTARVAKGVHREGR